MSRMREGDEDSGTRMFLLLNKSRKRVCTRWRCSSEVTGYSSWESDEGICGDGEFDDGNFCECEESRLSPFMYFCLNAANCLGVIQSVVFSWKVLFAISHWTCERRIVISSRCPTCSIAEWLHCSVQKTLNFPVRHVMNADEELKRMGSVREPYIHVHIVRYKTWNYHQENFPSQNMHNYPRLFHYL